MSHVELIVFRAKRYETILRRDLRARGCGLGQLIASCGSQLPSSLRDMLREVSRVRNVLVHEDEINELRDAKDFTELINRVEEDFALILPSFVPRTMIIGDLARKPATAMVFLANLASEIDELDIFDMFNFIARTLAVELAVNQCGDSRGVAVVHMASPEGARAAVREFDGKTVGGQRMILFVAGMGRGTEGTDVREIMARRDSLKR